MSKPPKVTGQWVELDEGIHRWCSCGLAKTQPFCDDSHRGTGQLPVIFVLEKPEKVILCMCKQTKAPPYCDGSHALVAGGGDFDEYL